MAKMVFPILVDYGSIKAELEKQDIVKVIRCKDCKHHEDEENGMVYCESVIGGWADEDWFCADGERKES